MVTDLPPAPRANKAGIAPAVRPLVTAVIGSAIVILLFSPVGVLYSKADLSFLTAPLLCLFLVRLAARLCGLYLPGYMPYKAGMAVSTVLNGLAFALCLYLFLDNVTVFNTRFGMFSGREDFLVNLSHTAWYTILGIAGLTLSKLAEIIRETISGRNYYPILNALGQFLAGLAVWRFLAAFSASGGVPDKIGLVLFTGMIAVALCNTGHYWEKAKNPFLADAANWLITGTMQKFVIGALIAVYILFVRPAIVNVFGYAAIIEWLIVCLIGWRIFAGITNGIRQRSAVEVNETDWKKHVQLLNNMQGDELPYLGDIQETFTKYGQRNALLIYLTLLLNKNKVTPQGMEHILNRLINHQDNKIPWFAFGWEQNRVRKQNEENRRRILNEVMTDLKYIINPASRKIEEQADEQNQP
jgi:hypothetical protein